MNDLGTGVGFVALDWLFAVLAVLASLANVAVLRSARVPESPVLNAVRRIRVAGWLLLALRAWYVLLTVGDLMVPLFSELPLLLLAFSDLLCCFGRLFSDLPDWRLRMPPRPHAWLIQGEP